MRCSSQTRALGGQRHGRVWQDAARRVGLEGAPVAARNDPDAAIPELSTHEVTLPVSRPDLGYRER